MTNKENLWIEYKKTNSQLLRKEIITSYLNLVHYIAGRLNVEVGYYIDYEDLVGYGIIGLIDAIDKFDINMGVKFETYATLRIRGAVLDNLRKIDWMPRSLRKKYKSIIAETNILENDLGREPTEREICKACKITLEELHETLSKAQGDKFLSLEGASLNKEIKISNISSFENIKGPEEILNSKETINMLKLEIDKLREKEKYVISLYYFEDLTLKEISKILEVSESRVSQIHSKALFKLSKNIRKSNT